jgi:hypothetical protein
VVYSLDTLSSDEIKQLHDFSATYKNVFMPLKALFPLSLINLPLPLTSRRGGSTFLYLSLKLYTIRDVLS